MRNIVEHRKFSLTNLGKNNNKMWNVTLFDDDTVSSVWGRQGKGEQSKEWAGVGRSFMDKKIREKEKKGYRENLTVEGSGTVMGKTVANSNLKDIARKQITHSNPLVAQLIDYFVQVNAHNIVSQTGGKIQFDTSSATFRTTQGIIVPDQIDRARVLLGELSIFISGSDYSNPEVEECLNEYLSLIPRDFGMQRVAPKDILPDIATVQKENDLLDGLDASFAGVTTQPKKKTAKKDAPKVFEMDLFKVVDNRIISKISKFFEGSKKSMHHGVARYRVKDIYAMKISSMKKAFDDVSGKVGNVMQLWHGSKASNLLSIFRQGLVIPPSSSAHCTGRMYSDGLYFSSVSTKALNYATNFWGSGGTTNRIFMFLAEVAMGKPYIAGQGWGSYPKAGYDSTWAKGGQSGVQNDEMIVYNVNQANLIYLVEFE